MFPGNNLCLRRMCDGRQRFDLRLAWILASEMLSPAVVLKTDVLVGASETLCVCDSQVMCGRQRFDLRLALTVVSLAVVSGCSKSTSARSGQSVVIGNTWCLFDLVEGSVSHWSVTSRWCVVGKGSTCASRCLWCQECCRQWLR